MRPETLLVEEAESHTSQLAFFFCRSQLSMGKGSMSCNRGLGTCSKALAKKRNRAVQFKADWSVNICTNLTYPLLIATLR